MKLLILKFLCVCAPFLLSGCGYKLLNSSSEHQLYGKKVWVDFVENSSASPTAQTVIRRSVTEQLQRKGGCRDANSPQDAELLLHGSLKSYINTAISYSSKDVIREYRLNISTVFEVKRRGEELPFWKGSVTAYTDYPATTVATNDLALQKNAEEAALADAARKIGESLATYIDEGF